VTAYIDVADCDDSSSSFECRASFSAVSNDSSSTVAGSAVLFGVGALAFLAVRKRRVAAIDLRKEEQLVDADGASGNCEMMSDNGVRV